MSGLSIKDRETERLVRDLARRTGVSLTQAVRAAVGKALAEEASRERDAERTRQIRRRAIYALLEEIDRLPKSGKLLSDDDLYDEDGLPR